MVSNFTIAYHSSKAGVYKYKQFIIKNHMLTAIFVLPHKFKWSLKFKNKWNMQVYEINYTNIHNHSHTKTTK